MASRGIRVPIVADDAQFQATLKRSTAAAKVFSAEMSDAQIKVALAQQKLTAATARYGEESAQAARATLGYRSSLEALSVEQAKLATRLDSIGRSTSHFGRTMTTNVSLPLAAAGVASVKLAEDFDKTISRFVGLAGVSAKQAQQWRQTILDLAPQLGKGPDELANALYQIASAGVKGKAAIEAMTVSAKASAAGLGDTATVADAVTSAMNAYAKTGLTAKRAADVLTAAVRDGKGEASAFAPVLGKVVAVASQLGVPFDQAAAALAQMTKLGVPADDAATQLSATFSGLLKTTPAAEKALEAMGLSAAGLRQELREKGLLATLETLKEHAHGSSVAMAEAFPNVRALRGVLQLVGDAAQGTSQVFKDTKNSTQSLSTAFDAAAKTNAFKMQQSLAQLKVAAIDLGEKLAPVATQIAHDAASIASAFDKLSPKQKDVLVKFAELAAVGGPVVLLTGKLLTMAGTIAKVSKELKVLRSTAALGPISVLLLTEFLPGSSSGQTVLNEHGVGGWSSIPGFGRGLQWGAGIGAWLTGEDTSGPLSGKRGMTPGQIAAKSRVDPATGLPFTAAQRRAQQYQAMAAAAAGQYGVPSDIFLKQINQESGFNPAARSNAGAIGIAQFMPNTAKGYGIDPRDPKQALPAAAKMMSGLYAKYHDWGLALAAYNAGSGAVDKYLTGKAPLPAETVAYVKAIMGVGVENPTDAAGGGDSNYDPAAAAKAAKKHKAAVIHGDALLPDVLRNAIAKAKNQATQTQGATAATWLRNEIGGLEAARKNLEGQLAGKTPKQQAAIRDEIRRIDSRIATVNKGIASNLRAQATAIKQAFSSKIAADKSAISAAVGQLKTDLDTAFAQATQTYIDTVLDPRFFQGTDAHGKSLQTPLEQQLAAMQSSDQKQQFQDAITAAKKQLELDKATVDVTAEQLAADQKAVDDAQRASDENDLAARAADERAQADHDYAEAVKQYQADRTEQERKMNIELDKFGSGLADGSKKISDLNGLVKSFGLTMEGITDPTVGIGFDFNNLSLAVKGLTQTLLDQTMKLGGPAAVAAVETQAASFANPGQVKQLDQQLLYAYALSGMVPHLADGGIVTRPTLALVGEAGHEAVIPLSRASLGGGGDIVIPVTLEIDGHPIFKTVQKYAKRDVLRGGAGVPG